MVDYGTEEGTYSSLYGLEMVKVNVEGILFLHKFFTDKGMERFLLVRQRPSTAIPVFNESEYTHFISTYCSQSTVFEHFVYGRCWKVSVHCVVVGNRLQQVPEIVLRLAHTYNT